MGVAGIFYGCYSAGDWDGRLRGRDGGKKRRRTRDASRRKRVRRLVRASDHGVDGIEDDCEQHPEDGREEEAAHDFDYGVGGEKAAAVGASGEAGVSGL